jgi:hypothetical protein
VPDFPSNFPATGKQRRGKGPRTKRKRNAARRAQQLQSEAVARRLKREARDAREARTE